MLVCVFAGEFFSIFNPNISQNLLDHEPLLLPRTPVYNLQQ